MINMNAHFQNVEFRMNRGDIHFVPEMLGSQLVRRSHRVFKGCYDFAVQGGAISTIKLYDPVFGKKQPLSLPAGFIVSKVLIDILTAPVGVGATIALSTGQVAADMLAATAITSLGIGLVDGIPTTAAATNIKVPSTQAAPGSGVTMAIATTALTAGKFNVFIQGYMSDAQ